jgi:hypothetical protein
MNTHGPPLSGTHRIPMCITAGAVFVFGGR